MATLKKVDTKKVSATFEYVLLVNGWSYRSGKIIK